MKNYLIVLIILTIFISCGSEYDNIKQEIEELEQQAQALKKEKEKLEKDNKQTQEKIDSLLDKCYLKSMLFTMEDNPMQLTSDVRCEIIGDSIVECWIPNITNSKELIARFEYEGLELLIGDKQAISGITIINYNSPTILTINSKYKKMEYNIFVYSFTGLPIIWIETSDRDNLAKDNYEHPAKFKLVEDCRTRKAGDVIEADIRIKHEGDYITYLPIFDGKQHTGKNTYSLQFENKVGLFDDNPCQGWELWANDEDDTMLRQQAAFHIGKLSKLFPSPKFHFVELMLNGRYCGTYLFGAQLEKENKASSIAVKEAEKALFSTDYNNLEKGWQKFIDKESIVDWYIVNEIFRNKDGDISSDYLACNDQSEKLIAGPIWKMNGILGQNSSISSDFVLKDTKWLGRLLKDSVFVSMTKERYDFFYQQRETIMKEIDADAIYLRLSVIENSKRWNIFDTKTPSSICRQYREKVDELKKWIETRMEWLHNEFKKD